MGNPKDLTNQRFGRLVAKKSVGKSKNGHYLWYCECDCGGSSIVGTGQLRTKHTRSCGCLSSDVTTERNRRYNAYDLTGEYGIGYTTKYEPYYFDLEDYDKIKGYCWSYNTNGYLRSDNLLMHRLIMNCPDDMDVDHIYQVHHDNRKSELRWATDSQNMMNTTIRSDNTSGVKGVSFTTRDNVWEASCTTDRKRIRKTFINKEDAIDHRKFLEEKYHGEFALKKKLEEGAI